MESKWSFLMHHLIKIYHSVKSYDNSIPNKPCGSRVMSIFIKRARPAKMMLGEASSPFCIPVAGQ